MTDTISKIAQHHGHADDPEPTIQGSRVSRLFAGVAVVLVLAVAGSTMFALREWNKHQDTTESARELSSAVSVAQRVALDLSTLDPTTIDTQMESLLSMSTGTFRTQLTGSKASQITAVRNGKIKSVGTVDSVGVTSSDSHSAVVAIALTAKVTGTKQSKPQTNLYRITLHLEKSKSTWLVSSLEFVS